MVSGLVYQCGSELAAPGFYRAAPKAIITRKSNSRGIVRVALMMYFMLLLFMIASTGLLHVHGEDLTADVIIVGAGICGIMAGKTLSERGITDFIILEATDRIGGRVRSQEFAGSLVELGANWVAGVHGDKLNPIWALANEVKLRTDTTSYANVTENTYNLTGPVPSEIATNVSDFINAQNKNITDLSRWLTENKKHDISVLTAQRFSGRVPSTPLEMAFEYNTYDLEYGEPPRLSSLKKTWPNPTFVDFGPDSEFVADPRGYVTIFQKVATYLEAKNISALNFTDSRLKYNKVVNKIQYSKTGAKVFTEDGSTYSAKIVILTVSIGVLQSNLIKYEPDLPFWKLEAIYQFDMAIYTKIFLKFPRRFWPAGPGTANFLYADGTRGYYPVWQHLERAFPGQNMIFATVTDMESKRIEQQSDNATQAEIMEVLRTMFGPNIPEPEAILVPRWWSNRFFGGSYTNWPIGINAPVFSEIRAPIDSLYFAGEGTSDGYFGYVHGGYFEGINVGKKVANCLQKKQCSSGSTKKAKRPNEKTVMESTCPASVREELDVQLM